MALAAEASLQQGFPLNDALFYLLVFCAVTYFYTEAYIVTESRAAHSNPRTLWYARHLVMVRRRQWWLLLFLLVGGGSVFAEHSNSLMQMSAYEWTLAVFFPVLGSMYYGIRTGGGRLYSLRNIGWLKPFVIGCTWAGIVTVYPVLFHHLIAGTHFEPGLLFMFLFIKNFMFVSVLCIMFDIKDYPMDYNQRLKTFVVNKGLRFTIFAIIIPLSLTGLISYFIFALWQHFTVLRICMNTIPFLLLLITAFTLQRPRSILYYLVVIDGLMLVKAICGIAASFYIRG
jgi:hypothetical protein